MVTGKCFLQPVKEYMISNFGYEIPFLNVSFIIYKMVLKNKKQTKTELNENY